MTASSGQTRAAISSQEDDAEALLDKLRAAREQYERDVAHRNKSSKFWRGLVNRWNKALEFAATFLGEEPATPIMRERPASVPAVPFDASEAAVADAMAEQRRSTDAAGPAVVRERLRLPVSAQADASMAAEPEPAPALMPALQLGSTGARVRAWQAFLLGQQLDPGQIRRRLW